MKEWALKHPWMTFFLADTIIGGLVTIIRTACQAVAYSKAENTVTEEAICDESVGDIQ